MRKLLGFDVGGTYIAVSLGTLHDRRLIITDGVVRRTRKGTNETFLADELISMAQVLMSRAGVSIRDVNGVGVATGGPLDRERGILNNPTNIRPDGPVALVKPLSSFFGAPVTWTNDANAGGLLEYFAGKGKGAHSLLYYTISTGIGWALIHSGEVYEGMKGNTEGGHFIMKPGGPPCNCGLRGCLESLSSGTAYARRAAAAMKSRKTLLKPGAQAKDVFLAARAGDELASEIVNEGIDYLARHVAGLITTLNPQKVILGGGVTKEGEFFFSQLKEGIARHSPPAGNLRAVDYIGPPDMGVYIGIASPFALLFENGRTYTVEMGERMRGMMV